MSSVPASTGPKILGYQQSKRRDELQEALAHCRSAFVVVGLFSLVINILLLASPIYMTQVYDRVLTTGHLETLAALTLIVGVALLLMSLLDTLRTAVTIRIGGWFNNQLGPILLASSVKARLQGRDSGAQPLRDLAQVQSFVGTQGLTAFFDFPWVPIFTVLIWMLHPLLGVIALLAALVLLALSIANEFVTRSPTVAANQAQIIATQHADAAIRNAEVVQAMGMLPAMVSCWKRHNDSSVESLRRAAERGGVIVSASKFIRFFVQIAILGVGATLVLQGELTSGGMIGASILLGRALAPVEVAMGAWRNFTATRIAYDRLRTQLTAFPLDSARIRMPDPKGELSVENVSYVVPGTNQVILRQVSFSVRPGEVVAVVGPSAAGKSTLCRFLVGLALPSGGTIRLDGTEIDHWDPQQLGQLVGYLPQNVELFSGTARENIARMGVAEDEDIIEAARLAHAHDMIQRLPEGYDTEIGDRGTKLSGGQRQRLGLARAVFGNPKLLVLDEPNANLDQAGESALAASLAELKTKGTAIIVVGHRPSTLAQADRILLLKDGRVELFGPRDEVLQRLRNMATNDAKGTEAAPKSRRAPAETQNRDSAAQREGGRSS